MRYYLLQPDHSTVLTENEMEAIKQWSEPKRRVAWSGEKDGIHVSTIFLVFDHACDGGEPMLFETMIFGGDHDQWQERCSTWEQAEEMHREACKLAGINSSI